MKKVSIKEIKANLGPEASSDSLAVDEAKDLEIKRLTLENQNLEQNIDLRRRWANKAFYFTASIIVGVFAIVSIDAVFEGFEVHESVLIALITGVAVESIGITAIVARYLFPS